MVNPLSLFNRQLHQTWYKAWSILMWKEATIRQSTQVHISLIQSDSKLNHKVVWVFEQCARLTHKLSGTNGKNFHSHLSQSPNKNESRHEAYSWSHDPEQEVQDRVNELGKQITEHYQGSEDLVLALAYYVDRLSLWRILLVLLI